MKDLSVAEGFMLCSLNKKGRLPWIGKEVVACLLAGAVIELLAGGSVEMDGRKKLRVKGALDGSKVYLRPLYDYIDKPKPVGIEAVAREYCFSLTERRLNELICAIGNSLAEKGCVTVKKDGILAGRPSFVPDAAEVDRVIREIRTELLESVPITDETAVLASLLLKSRQINRYFPKHEVKQIKYRLAEMRQAPSGRITDDIAGYVERLLSVMAAMVAVS